MTRLRIWYSKNGPMRYTGSLDVQKTWERIIRRSGLNLSYSQGFHPKARINQASPLPLGYIGANEIIDVWLVGECDLQMALDNIQKACPPGIQVLRMAFIQEDKPNLQSCVKAAEYVIKMDKRWTPNLAKNVTRILGSESIMRTRGNKTYDLRPLIMKMELNPEVDANNCYFLCMTLSATEGKTGRPDEVLLELGIDPGQVLIERVNIFFIN